jgi:glycosylphosphatidylinositol transamidase (GPIT) subunit GPI8
LIDRFSHSVSAFFNSQTGITVGNDKKRIKNEKKNSKKKKLNVLRLQDLINSLDPRFLYSTPTVLQSKETRHPKDILLMDFFGQPKTDINLLNVSIFGDIVKGDVYDNSILSDDSDDLKVISIDRKREVGIDDDFNSFYLSSDIHAEYKEEYIEPSSGYSNYKKKVLTAQFEYTDPIHVIMHIFVVISFIYFVLEFIV